MQRAKRICYTVACVFATWLVAGVAAADEQTPQKDMPAHKDMAPTQVMATKQSATATVEKVDAKKRTLLLKDEQGDEFKVNVPEKVTRLDAIKKGDTITLDYYEAVSLSLKKPDAGKAPSANETMMAERTPGKLPGGVVAKKVSATVEVTKVDKAENEVTIKGPGGDLDTIKVSDPEMQAQLENIKEGDRIKATYTEAVAISVTPKKKEG